MRPADVDKLKGEIADLKAAIQTPSCDYVTGYISALSVVEGMIATLPTIILDDLRPKGRWVEKEESLGWGDVGVAECSVCEENWVLGEWSFEEFAEWHKFCPSCGADMRGGGEDG